jgi:hypothetical protein
VAHLVLGFLATLSPFFLIGVVYALLLSFLNIIYRLRGITRAKTIVYFLSYFSAFEVISRMSRSSPFIPYELGKYLAFIILFYGIIELKGLKVNGILLVLLLIPGIILALPNTKGYGDIIFNVFGLINLGLGISFFSTLKKSGIDLYRIVRLMIYPLLSALVFTIIRTPSFDDIEFKLGAMTSTSGGFGSNQVSTAFGLALFLVFLLWYSGYSFSGLPKIVDLGIALMFLFQGLLTFSRGGLIGGVIAIVILFIGSLVSVTRKSKIKPIYFVIAVPIAILIISYANKLSGGNLFLRYQGETTGTLKGTKEKDLNQLTTGRSEIFLEDVKLFQEYPIFGVGVGQSRYFRKGSEGVEGAAAHIEMTRLLSEHGIFGLLIVIVLIFQLIKKLLLLQGNKEKLVLFLFYLIGFYTTFHAATRTFISPLLMSLSFIPVGNFYFRSKKENNIQKINK